MDDFNLARPEGDRRYPTDVAFRWLAGISKSRIPIIMTVITGALLSLVAFSPLLLNQIARSRGLNWQTLGNVGQAYGGASAILAGIALVGIAASLVIQTRQARTERVRLVRERHGELLRLVLDNPKIYAPVLGTRTPATVDEVRQFIFSTMLMNYTLMGYELGVITKLSLTEEIFPSIFATAAFRNWWAVSGKYWSPHGNMTRRERQFRRLLRDQYLRAANSGQPPLQRTIDEPPTVTQGITKVPKWAIPVSAAIGVSLGIFLQSIIRRYS